MKTPLWAQDLAVDALVYLEGKGFKAEIPQINWRHGKGYKDSSGVCHQLVNAHITITAGTDKRDAKLVLLHELAHWALPLGEHHGNTFWHTAFDLFRWAGLPQRVCIDRESNAGRSRRRITRLAKEVCNGTGQSK